MVMTTVLLLALAAGCTKEEAKQTTEKAKEKAQNVAAKVTDAVDDVGVPFGGPPDDPKAREQQRLDEQWRQLQSFREQQAAIAAAQQQQQQQQAAQQAAEQAAAAAQLQIVPRTKKTKESFKGLTVDAINSGPVLLPIRGDLSGPSVLKAQVYLDRADFSVNLQPLVFLCIKPIVWAHEFCVLL